MLCLMFCVFVFRVDLEYPVTKIYGFSFVFSRSIPPLLSLELQKVLCLDLFWLFRLFLLFRRTLLLESLDGGSIN